MKWIISTAVGVLTSVICHQLFPETYNGGWWSGVITLAAIALTKDIVSIFTDNSYGNTYGPKVVHMETKEKQQYKDSIIKLEEEKKNLQSELNVANAKVVHCDEKIAYERKRYEELNKDLIKAEHERDDIWKSFQDLLHSRQHNGG